MERKTAPIGTCKICGSYGKLSFEHVPPSSAFNENKIRVGSLDKNLNYLETLKFYGKIEQRGAGYYSLCEKCNNSTGRWYVPYFAEFAFQGAALLKKSGYHPTLLYCYHFFPLRVIKQIITMFFSVNSEGFRMVYPDLVKFILNPTEKYLDPRYKIYIYYNYEGLNRFLGFQVHGTFTTGDMRKISEISFPPFGYVITFDSEPIDELYCINHFANYSYSEILVDYIKLPVLPTNSLFALDYRSKTQINKEMAEALKFKN
jgi:hypothetical protein